MTPEVERKVSLVSVVGRSFSPAMLTFMEAVRNYDWRGHSGGKVQTEPAH